MSVDPCNYFVKAILPASGWRTPHVTKAAALERAIWFVRQWQFNGFPEARAGIFYRDGRLQLEITSANLAEGGSN